MSNKPTKVRSAPSGPASRSEQKEPLLEQIASFVGFFVYLLVLKSFFLPLFIIPTGSEAEVLMGQYAAHTCPNCGTEYPVGLPLRVPIVQCPNCRWQENAGSARERAAIRQQGIEVSENAKPPLHSRAGDRIMVHGWTHALGGIFAPKRWEITVFKVPSDGQTNYIKRLVGKPGETVEIIDGDIFITDPKTGLTDIARKPRHAQEALWFPYYDHDHPAREPGAGGRYYPRWTPTASDNGWAATDTRCPRFDGGSGRGEILFTTAPGDAREPGKVADVYGYNGGYQLARDANSGAIRAVPMREYSVTDVRLNAEVTLEDAGEQGYIELSASKYADQFFVRLHPDGRITLEHARTDDAQRETWGQTQVAPLTGRPVRVALSNVDRVVSVELNGKTVISSKPEQYSITAERARELSHDDTPPRLAFAAEDVKVALAHVLIERDLYYTGDMRLACGPGYGTQGNAITLGPTDYFFLGDNSPQSLDCRFSFAQDGTDDEAVGAHLRAAYEQGHYQLGTVPADQIIGPAFLVYWPGTDALLPDRFMPGWLSLINQLPSPGRVRWIH